jgi:hypothetical protein
LLVGDSSTTAQSLSGGGGDDTLVYDSAHTSIDGGTGLDTLILDNEPVLDFSAVSNLSNIEQLDLNAFGDHEVTLNFDDVVRITEASELTILGDSGDTVHLSNGTGTWDYTGQQHDAGSNTTFNVYEQGGALVKIEDGIAVDIV